MELQVGGLKYLKYLKELKEDEEAVKTLRKLLARYAEAFPDARAAYALVLWDQGDRIEAEPWTVGDETRR